MFKVILFENERLFFSADFRGQREKYKASARNLFTSADFFKCFTDGMQSEVAFVRYHYVQFLQKLVPLMQKVILVEDLARHVGNLVDVFSEILSRADVSAYESQTLAGRIIISQEEGDEEHDISDEVAMARRDQSS